MLYGEDGSREGGTVGGTGGRSTKVDREFDRLVALADPEMGDGAGGTDGKVLSNASSAVGLSLYIEACSLLLGPCVCMHCN